MLFLYAHSRLGPYRQHSYEVSYRCHRRLCHASLIDVMEFLSYLYMFIRYISVFVLKGPFIPHSEQFDASGCWVSFPFSSTAWILIHLSLPLRCGIRAHFGFFLLWLTWLPVLQLIVDSLPCENRREYFSFLNCRRTVFKRIALERFPQFLPTPSERALLLYSTRWSQSTPVISASFPLAYHLHHLIINGGAQK